MRKTLLLVIVIVLGCSAYTTKQANEYVGYLDYVGCAGVFGWDAEFVPPVMVPYTVTDERVLVDIYVDGVLVRTVTADEWRPDLVPATVGDGRHGFDYKFSAVWFDGQPHVVAAFDHTSGVQLQHSPRTLICSKR